MALQYTTGTINQPDAGSVGLSMVEKIRDDVVAHPAWDLVDEFTPGSGLVRWYVLKCLAAQSGLPDDFYVVIGRTLGSGELSFTLCEGYNSVAKTISFYAQFSTNVNYDGLGRSNSTYVLGTAVLGTSSTWAWNDKWAPSGTSTKWWLIVDNDGFTVAFNGASNSFVHLGRYIPLTQVPIPMPICIMGRNTSSAALTRNPAVAGLTAYQVSSLLFYGAHYTNSGSPYFIPLGFPGHLQYNDKLQNNERPVAECGMVLAVSANDIPQTGWALGKHKRMRTTDKTAPVGFAFGDAYAMQGRLWVPYHPADLRFWDTGVAAS